MPDETLAVELEQLRRITRIRQRRKSDKAKSSFTCCSTLEERTAPLGAPTDQVRFPTKDEYFAHDGAHADATLSGAFVYGGPDLRQKFWLVDDDDEDIRSDEDDISDPSDDESDTPEDDPQTPSDIEEHHEQAWKVAREALFCCRELVRTEKSYFSKLVQLKDGQTLTPPPSLLTSYIPALILASNSLLEQCSQDPTVYGISTAFLQTSVQLENALVAYCGIVGDIFSTKRASRRKLVRSRRSSGSVDEPTRSPPPIDSNSSWNVGRKSFNAPSSSQLPFFGTPDKRKSMPVTTRSTLDISCPFPRMEPPSSPLPTESEVLQDPKTNPRRSFSLFRRKTSPQTTSPVPSPPKAKSSWRRFRSSSKSSIQCLGDPSEVIESPPPPMNRVPPRPTRPIPPVPQESAPASEPGESNRPSNARRYHNRSASLQEAYISPAESPLLMGWTSLNSTRRGGASLDMNHVIGSPETSTHSSHNRHFGTEGRRERTPTVRDLAILPAQRVMRYVLLFKDILDHTPEDVPSRPLIAQAFDEALRIAEKCDRAQGNAAFLRRA